MTETTTYCDRCAMTDELQPARAILFDTPEEGTDSRVCWQCLLALVGPSVLDRLAEINNALTDKYGAAAAAVGMEQVVGALRGGMPDVLSAEIGIMVVGEADNDNRGRDADGRSIPARFPPDHPQSHPGYL